MSRTGRPIQIPSPAPVIPRLSTMPAGSMMSSTSARGSPSTRSFLIPQLSLPTPSDPAASVHNPSLRRQRRDHREQQHQRQPDFPRQRHPRRGWNHTVLCIKQPRFGQLDHFRGIPEWRTRRHCRSQNAQHHHSDHCGSHTWHPSCGAASGDGKHFERSRHQRQALRTPARVQTLITPKPCLPTLRDHRSGGWGNRPFQTRSRC